MNDFKIPFFANTHGKQRCPFAQRDRSHMPARPLMETVSIATANQSPGESNPVSASRSESLPKIPKCAAETEPQNRTKDQRADLAICNLAPRDMGDLGRVV